MKKLVLVLVLSLFSTIFLTGCLSRGFDASGEISVISREEGSGTRGAFIELFEIEQKNSLGEKVDYTTVSAITTNSTGVMLTNVSDDPQAIGYVSLGSYNDSVKGLQIDGVTPTVANIKNGTYKISRPFNIATKGDVSSVTADFIAFIMSAEGQAIVEDNGYIASSDNPVAYNGVKPSGKIVIAGSSSITPIMEKLKEAYVKLNFNATIEIQLSDSTTGMTSVDSGICDIGMASRALKDSELAKGLNPQVIALDGIVVIVNKTNTFTNLTTTQVKDIFIGEVTSWQGLNG